MNDQRTNTSNFGECVSIYAPGGLILTEGHLGTPSTRSGTSFAAPHVAGVIALFLSNNKAAKGAETAWRAFNRYFAMTELEIPLSDEADAVRKREAKAKREAEMKAIPDLGKAIADAVAVMDFDKAKKLKAEETRRKTEEIKGKNQALEAELKPIKDAIRDELQSLGYVVETSKEGTRIRRG
jgi:subtilisin family serine protease